MRVTPLKTWSSTASNTVDPIKIAPAVAEKSGFEFGGRFPPPIYNIDALFSGATSGLMSNFCPILCIGDFLRMCVKPEVVVRFWRPTNSSSQFWSWTIVQNLVTIGKELRTLVSCDKQTDRLYTAKAQAATMWTVGKNFPTWHPS